MVNISLVDITDFLFPAFFPVDIRLFRQAGSKTIQKSSMEQNISVISSVETMSRILVSILIVNTLIYKKFCSFYVEKTFS